ncbi:MAG: hypothetical protein ABFD97_26275 [Syntrophobacter sp.]
MAILDDLKEIISGMDVELREKKGVFSFEKVIAERKAFLSRKKLTYAARFRIDVEKAELRFTEMLKESGFGISSGEGDIGPGFGFKKETYSSSSKGREGTITEQSVSFGKKYSYTFNYGEIRAKVEEIAGKNGYAFRYLVTGVGL